ncbi:hypothetical protein AJ80_08189 [Polytolypa hystricis UAMH7299]|uniref:Cytochrome P450 n=1 Tax=Polytolypa hystricis (strain UAMH7299) TaxID=1447883 RepID=A0A2B7XBL3_POLH7|nr:hypothetical protein AJ80_08189 [Polytolypa hystricis UAMH7299]
MKPNTSVFPQTPFEDAKEFVSEHYFRSLFLLLLLICVVTRIVTGLLSYFPSRRSDGSQRARRIPYWIPYFGHSLSLGLARKWLLVNARKSVDEPVFRLHICGNAHNVVTSPSMAKAILENDSSTSPDSFINRVMEKAFGSQKKLRNPQRLELCKKSKLMEYLMDEPHVSETSLALSKTVERYTPGLLSFVPSVVDQTPWERMNRITVVQEGNSSYCEADFYCLIRNFVGRIITSNLMGSTFMEAAPGTLPDLWTFNGRFNAFLMGIPRWIPFPTLPSAYAARHRLLQAMEIFQKAMTMVENGQDPGFDWRDLDDVSELMKSRSRTWRDAGVSTKLTAPEDLALLWAINTKANTVIFWQLIRILANPELHAKILKEIAPFARAYRPSPEESGFHIQEPPRLSLNVDRLIDSCPLLKATYYETLRLHSSAFSYRKVTKDLTVKESAADAEIMSREPRSYYFRAGEFVAVPHTLHNTNSHYFVDPNEFKPEGFLTIGGTIPEKPSTESEEADGLLEKQHGNHALGPKIAAQMEQMWPFFDDGSRGDETTSEGAEPGLTERTVLMFTAAILSLWDIKPAGGKEWKIPKQSPGFAVYSPRSDLRVRMNLRV